MAENALKLNAKIRRELAGLDNVTAEPLFARIELGTTGNALSTPLFPGGSDKTQTNVVKAAELPIGHLAIIEEIRISFPPDVVVADLQELEKEAVLEFAPNETAKRRHFPIEMLGAGGGPNTATTTVATHGVPQHNAVFKLRKPEVIRGGVPFVCNLIVPTAVTPSAATKVLTILAGIYAYPAGAAAS